MADYLTTDTELTSVANAIRTKGGTSAQLVYPAGFVSAIEAIPTGGGGVETAHIYADLSMGGNAYYTDANGNVGTEVINYDTGMVEVNDDAPVGSLVVFYAMQIPMTMVSPTGMTYVGQISSQTMNLAYVYQVTS